MDRKGVQIGMVAALCLIAAVFFVRCVLDRLDSFEPAARAAVAQVQAAPSPPAAVPERSSVELSSELAQTGRDFEAVADQWEDLFNRMLPELYRQRATIRKLERALAECRKGKAP